MRWIVPKASLIKISPRLAQYLPKFSSLVLSFLPSKSSKRVFSIRITLFGFILEMASSNFGPLVSSMKVTFLRKYLDKQADTGFKVFFSLSSSVFTLPRWDIKITLAPWFIAYLIVLRLDLILVSSVISPSFIGTLKSHLIITFFPSKSKSFIVFFIFSLLSCNICIS